KIGAALVLILDLGPGAVHVLAQADEAVVRPRQGDPHDHHQNDQNRETPESELAHCAPPACGDLRGDSIGPPGRAQPILTSTLGGRRALSVARPRPSQTSLASAAFFIGIGGPEGPATIRPSRAPR